MPLRGRVGRHARTGANCQNWKSDQLAVIALLNAIPAADGGAHGTLTGRVIGGIASDALYQAILRYQKKHFPAAQTGFIEPAGPMLTHMQKLASRPPPPKPPGQWDDIKTDTVRKPLRAGLLDDRHGGSESEQQEECRHRGQGQRLAADAPDVVFARPPQVPP